MNILLIAGARPNFMKIAPLIKAIQAYNSVLNDPLQTDNGPTSTVHRPLAYRLIHTGQHYDAKMSDVFFQELGIPAPDINLEVGSGSHAVQTANIMLKFEPVLLNAFSCHTLTTDNGSPSTGTCPPSPVHRPPSTGSRPDWLVVVGDVNSTMACTLVAAKLGVKVAHVEAGLRSFDRSMPEEINRIVTDGLADLLLTPSEDANENLKREGVPESKIRLVGNIMIDSLVANLDQARQRNTLGQFGLQAGQFAFVTLHRPSNVDHRESLQAIMGELNRLSRQVPVVFPMHPRTRKMLGEFGIPVASGGNLKILEPIGYHDSLCLTEKARLVLTDSGGLQEETTYFRTPCLTLRPNTERPITVTVGSNRLTDISRLRADLDHVLQNGDRLGCVPDLWDGRTAERTVQALLEFETTTH